MGLDIGTTSICGLVLDPASGEVAARVTAANASAIAARAPGDSLQDPDVIVSIANGILQRFFRRFRDVSAIGITGQMHGILYVDAHGLACSPLFTWQDGRGDRDRGPGSTYASYLSERLASPVSTGMGFVTHFVNRELGLVPSDAAMVCTAADYVAMRLTGARVPVMDVTNAASLGCFDLEAGDFDRASMESLGIDPGLFPRPAAGRREGRPAAGYPTIGEAAPRVPIMAALGDNQASFLGSVRDAASSILVNVGTGSQISIFTSHPVAGPVISARPYPFGGFLAVGAALCGGRANAMLRGFLQRTLRLFGGRPERVTWEAMNEITDADLDTTERLTVDARFAGTRHDPSVRGSIRNLGPGTFTPEHLIVGIREGIVGELLDFYDVLPGAERSGKSSLVGSGNGLRLNPALRRAFERRLRMPMSVPAHTEEASFGAALLAGVAAGIIPDLAAAGRLIRFSAS
jgi:sedoheptulokinase